MQTAGLTALAYFIARPRDGRLKRLRYLSYDFMGLKVSSFGSNRETDNSVPWPGTADICPAGKKNCEGGKSRGANLLNAILGTSVLLWASSPSFAPFGVLQSR